MPLLVVPSVGALWAGPWVPVGVRVVPVGVVPVRVVPVGPPPDMPPVLPFGRPAPFPPEGLVTGAVGLVASVGGAVVMEPKPSRF